MLGFYDFQAKLVNGRIVPMSDYEGQVVLLVNIASQCKLAPQLSQLTKLYNEFSGKGFSILGFPSDQFAQEPLNNFETQLHCSQHYGVRFPMFEKISVNGPQALPLYQFLKKEKPGFLFSEAIKWNFTKFLVDANGKVVGRYGPTTSPLQLAEKIQGLLDASVH